MDSDIPVRYHVYTLAHEGDFKEKEVSFKLIDDDTECRVPIHWVLQPSPEMCRKAANKIFSPEEALIMLANLGIPSKGVDRFFLPDVTQEDCVQSQFDLHEQFDRASDDYKLLLKLCTGKRCDVSDSKLMHTIFTIPGCYRIVESLVESLADVSISGANGSMLIPDSVLQCIEELINDIEKIRKNVEKGKHYECTVSENNIQIGTGHTSPYSFPFAPWMYAYNKKKPYEIPNIPGAVSWATKAKDKRITNLCILGEARTHNIFQKQSKGKKTHNSDDNQQWVLVKKKNEGTQRAMGNPDDEKIVKLWEESMFIARIVSVVWLFAKAAVHDLLLTGKDHVCSEETPACKAMTIVDSILLKNHTKKDYTMQDIMGVEDLVYIWTIVVHNMQNRPGCMVDDRYTDLFLGPRDDDDDAVLHLNPSFFLVNNTHSVMNDIDANIEELFKCYTENKSCFKLIELENITKKYKLPELKSK